MRFWLTCSAFAHMYPEVQTEGLVPQLLVEGIALERLQAKHLPKMEAVGSDWISLTDSSWLLVPLKWKRARIGA